MKRKLLIGLVSALLFVVTMVFIKFNNDHLECEQVVERRYDANGTIVTEKEHVCREKFNF